MQETDKKVFARTTMEVQGSDPLGYRQEIPGPRRRSVTPLRGALQDGGP
jgi:hypothetical protein